MPINIADKNYMKAPKLERKEADFLDDEQVKQVLELLDKEPIKWKTAIYLLIFSGIRRGELLGLEWIDIDFENKVIHIKSTSQYVQGMGIITKCPKMILLSVLLNFLLIYLNCYMNITNTGLVCAEI